MAGRKWRGRASGKQCQEYIPQVSAWVPALTICSALGLANAAAGSDEPRMDGLAAGAVHQCNRRRAMQHVLVAPFHQGEQHQRRDTAVAGADGRPGANAGLGASADPDERVLYQSRADDFRRGVCRPALRLPGGGDPLWLADRRADDGRPRPGGIDPRTVDHDGDLCRVCRRLHQSGIGR